MKEKRGREDGSERGQSLTSNNSFRILKKVTFLTREGPLASALLLNPLREAYLMLLSAQDC